MKSKEESMFAAWLDEAVTAGLVSSWFYEVKSFGLVPKQVCVVSGKTMFQPATYTPDFKVWLTLKGMSAFPQWQKFGPHEYVWIDVKGAYDPFRKDDRFLSLIRKIMWQVYKIYVIKQVVDKKFWESTWLPEAYRYCAKAKTTTGEPKISALGKKCRNVQQFVDAIQGVQGELL